MAVLPSLYFAKGNMGFPKYSKRVFGKSSRVEWHKEPTHHVPDDIRTQKIPRTATVMGKGLTLEGNLKISTGLQSQYKP